MLSDDNANSLIESALALSEADRFALMDVIHLSLVDPSLNHGDQISIVTASDNWSEELQKRMKDYRAGVAKTLPADQAERMIRDDAKPAI